MPEFLRPALGRLKYNAKLNNKKGQPIAVLYTPVLKIKISADHIHPTALELYHSVLKRKERKIPAHADVKTSPKLRTLLTDDDIARPNLLSAGTFYAPKLRVTVSAVACRTLSLFMRHKNLKFNFLPSASSRPPNLSLKTKKSFYPDKFMLSRKFLRLTAAFIPRGGRRLLLNYIAATLRYVRPNENTGVFDKIGPVRS